MRSFVASLLLVAGCASAAASTEAQDDSSSASSTIPTTGTTDTTGTIGAVGNGAGTPLASGTDAGTDAATTVETCSTRTTGYTAGKTLKVGNATRTYDLYVPPGAASNLPIVLVFHADDGVSLRTSLGLEAVTGAKAIVAYPHGNNNQWNLGAPTNNDDYAFVDALKAELGKTQCGDTSRTYGFGFSNGAFFVNLMSCYRAGAFRAIVAHSGGLYAPSGVTPTYDGSGSLVCPAAPPAVLVIHGQADNVVSYNDDGVYSRNSWALNDACGTKTAASSPSPCTTYTSCTKNPVGFCGVPGMGHQLWSSAATAAWGFLSQF